MLLPSLCCGGGYHACKDAKRLDAMCHLQVTCMTWDEKERYLATSDGAEAKIWSVFCPPPEQASGT